MSEDGNVSSDCAGESPLPTRNPSPPPELYNNEAAVADIVKGTMISKEWIYSILLKLIKEVDKPNKTEGGEGGGEEESEFGVDVDEGLQEQLCLLWDMSMNTRIATFLQECKAVSILAKVITYSKAPRINEICVGILGNMCCVPELCEEMAHNETLITLVCALLSNTEFDPLTLKETMRLLYTSLSNKAVSIVWQNTIKENPQIKQLIIFVLQSSTNNDLLKTTGDVVDLLLDLSDDLCQDWTSTDLLLAALEAVKQIGYQSGDELRPFLHVFQLMSTSQTGVQALVDHGESLLELLVVYLARVCDEEIVGIEDHMASLTSIVSILHLLFTSDPAIAESITAKASVFEHLLKVLDALYCTGYHPNSSADLPECLLAARSDSVNSQGPDDEQDSGKQPGGRGSKDSNRKEDRSTDGSRSERNSQDRDTRGREQSDGGEGEGGSSAKEQGERRDVEGREKEGGGAGESAGRRGSVYDPEKQQMRLLFELLQNFFRDFINSLQLEDENGCESSSRSEKATETETEGKSDAEANPPLFLPFLRYLNACPHHSLGYLVHALVQNLPDLSEADRAVEEEKGEGGEGEGSFSRKGRRSVEHLGSLCRALGLNRAVRILTRVVKSIR